MKKYAIGMIMAVMMGTLLALGANPEPQSLKKRVHGVIVTKLDFAETPLHEVLTQLAVVWSELATPGEKPKPENEMNFVLQISEEKTKELKVTLKLAKIPYDDAVKYVTQSVGLKYRIEDYAIVIYAPAQTAEKQP